MRFYLPILAVFLIFFSSHAQAETNSCVWSLAGGLSGSKQPQDLGIQAHVGARIESGFSFALFESAGIGLELGTALHYEGAGVGVMEPQVGTKSRTQIFKTIGFFSRGEKWGAGLAYDFQYQNYYRDFLYHQVRAQFDFAVGALDTVGVWGAFGLNSEQTSYVVGTTTNNIELKPLAQGHLFWQRNWMETNAIRFWIGLSGKHGRFVQALQNTTTEATGLQLAYGGDFHIPLSESLGLIGQANFILPHDSGTVDAFFGLRFYPDGNAKTVHTNRYAPYMGTANNPNFAVDLRLR